MFRRTVSAIMLTILLTSMFASVFNLFSAAAEPPSTEWDRTYGGTDDDHAYSMVQTGGGGYALAGSTRSYGGGSADFWLVKTDSSGNKLWDKTYGGSSAEIAYSMIQTSDGGYALAGYTSATYNFHYDFWLVRTDAAGNKLWSTSFGGAGNEEAYSVIQTSDGGFGLVGYTDSFGAGSDDFWFVKTDANGNMLWNKTYGGTDADLAYSVVQTSDGGYAVAGLSWTGGAQDFWLVKTDAVGNVSWTKSFGGTGTDFARSVIQTSDGGFALAGDSYYPVWGFLLVKTDATGNMLWSRSYQAASGGGEEYSLIQTSDGGYALAGRTGGGTPDFWVVKTDAAGNALWNSTYGGSGADGPHSVVQTTDGGFALAGYTYSYGAGSADFWLVKVGGTLSSAPIVTGVDPPQPTGGAVKQMLSILGEGFVSNSEVTLSIGSDDYTIPQDRTLFINPNKIEIAAGLFDQGLWKAWVTNPGAIQSNKYAFQVHSVSTEGGKKVLSLALQYWSVENAVIMTAIARAETGWIPNAAGDRGYSVFNCMGYASWGLWQIFMGESWEGGNKELLGTLGAPIDNPYETAKWLSNPNENVKAAYAVWKILGFRAWTMYKNGEYKTYIADVTKMRTSVFRCPVNVTITDDYNRTISETENQIPGASFEYYSATDTRIFYLPLNLTYKVQLNATDYGNCTIGQITPTESIYETAFSQGALNLTSETVAEFDLPQYEANYTLKVDENGDGLIDYELAPELETLDTEYDIGITEVAPSKTVIGQGYDLSINTTVVNCGAHAETFNVTFHVEETFESQNVTLTNGTFTTITFVWNTTGFSKGNYTINAYIDPVPNETLVEDNNVTCIVPVHVGVPGDISGPTPGVYDGTVNMRDIQYLILHFNTYSSSLNWKPNADINNDGTVNMRDIQIAILNFNQHE